MTDDTEDDYEDGYGPDIEEDGQEAAPEDESWGFGDEEDEEEETGE